MSMLRSNGRIWLICSALLAGMTLTWLMYWPGVHGPFQLDDLYNIPPTKVSSLSWEELRSVTFNNTSGPLRRPVSVLTFALNHYFTGPEALGFKATNIALHSLNAMLLLWLGLLLLRRVEGATRIGARLWIVCGIAALIWAIHPLQVSTVLYAVQRMAMLAGTFTLAALLCYAILRQRLESGEKPIRWPAILLGVFALLAVLSKESGALVAFYILVVEVVVFRFAHADAGARKRLYAVLCAYSLLPILVGCIYFFTHADALLADYQYRDFTLSERLLTQPAVLWFYVKLILLPNITEMSIFHDDFPISSLDVSGLLALFGIAALALAAVFMRHKTPVLAFGVLWFLASQAIESTVFPLELVFEHRNYLAAWGLLLPVAFYLIPSGVGQAKQQLRAGLTVAIVGVLAFQTQLRASTWSDIHLWTATTVREHPESARAHHAYARLLSDLGKNLDALQHAREAERLKPRHAGYTISVLATECVTGQLTPATIERLQAKLASQPPSEHALAGVNNLMKLSAKGLCPALDGTAIVSLAKATATGAALLPPAKRSATFTLLALAQARFLEDKGPAIDTLRAAHRDAPESIMPLVMIGFLQAEIGDLAAARATLAQARTQNARNLSDQSALLTNLENALELLESETR